MTPTVAQDLKFIFQDPSFQATSFPYFFITHSSHTCHSSTPFFMCQMLQFPLPGPCSPFPGPAVLCGTLQEAGIHQRHSEQPSDVFTSPGRPTQCQSSRKSGSPVDGFSSVSISKFSWSGIRRPKQQVPRPFTSPACGDHGSNLDQIDIDLSSGNQNFLKRKSIRSTLK